MRTNILLTTLLASAFLAVAAGAAFAQAPSEPRGGERAAMHAEMREARNASIHQFAENRTAALTEYRASINATRASFLENKTLVIDGCRAARNASADDNNSAFAKCVSDGLKPLIESARAAHAEARETLHDKLLAARENARAGFESHRSEIRGRHAPPS